MHKYAWVEGQIQIGTFIRSFYYLSYYFFNRCRQYVSIDINLCIDTLIFKYMLSFISSLYGLNIYTKIITTKFLKFKAKIFYGFTFPMLNNIGLVYSPISPKNENTCKDVVWKLIHANQLNIQKDTDRYNIPKLCT